MRRMVVEIGERVDGRAADEIRPIMVKGDYLPLVHGSGLFQRLWDPGALSCRLACLERGGQSALTPSSRSRASAMHHYNFPPFCTERDRPHGPPEAQRDRPRHLAERARCPSRARRERVPVRHSRRPEAMESNGSSSMAPTCGSCLPSWTAVCPSSAPVSGIARA